MDFPSFDLKRESETCFVDSRMMSETCKLTI